MVVERNNYITENSLSLPLCGLLMPLKSTKTRINICETDSGFGIDLKIENINCETSISPSFIITSKQTRC